MADVQFIINLWGLHEDDIQKIEASLQSAFDNRDDLTKDLDEPAVIQWDWLE